MKGALRQSIFAQLRRRLSRRHVVLFVVASLVFVPTARWGVPHATAGNRTEAWGVDDEPPTGPLAQLYDIVNPAPTQNPNLGYPMLHPFLVLATFAPYVTWLRATGGLGPPTEAFPHGFTDPVTALATLSLLAHLLSVLLAAGIVVAAYETGRTLWDERAGLWGAAFAGLAYPMFYYARTSNVDVPVLFFTAVAGIPFARALMLGPTRRRALWLGALIGLALATKEPAFASFVGVPFALLFLPRPGESTASWRNRETWSLAAWCALAVVLAYVVGSGMIVDPDRWMAHIRFIRERSAEAVEGAVAFMPYYPRSWSGNVALGSRLLQLMADAMTGPGLVLGGVGVALAARRTPRAAWFAVTVVTYLAILFWSARAAQLRYVMPAVYALSLFAGYAVRELLAARPAAVRAMGGAAAAAAVVLASLRGADLTWAMAHDSRYAAAAWLREHGKPGDRLEFFGSMQKEPPMEGWMTSGFAVEYLGGNVRAPRDSATVAKIIRGWHERRPRFVSLIPDYTSHPGEPFAASCPPEIFEKLEAGTIGYRRVALFQSPPLLPWLRRPPLDYPVVNPPIRIYERVETPPG